MVLDHFWYSSLCLSCWVADLLDQTEVEWRRKLGTGSRVWDESGEYWKWCERSMIFIRYEQVMLKRYRNISFIERFISASGFYKPKTIGSVVSPCLLHQITPISTWIPHLQVRSFVFGCLWTPFLDRSQEEDQFGKILIHWWYLVVFQEFEVKKKSFFLQ
mgnify:CR=1 FL=1